MELINKIIFLNILISNDQTTINDKYNTESDICGPQ